MLSRKYGPFTATTSAEHLNKGSRIDSSTNAVGSSDALALERAKQLKSARAPNTCDLTKLSSAKAWLKSTTGPLKKRALIARTKMYASTFEGFAKRWSN